MNNEKEWKELKEEQKIRESEIISEYGFNITEYAKKELTKEKFELRVRRKKIIKKVVIVIVLIILSIYEYSLHIKECVKAKNDIYDFAKNHCDIEVEILPEKIFWNGSGFYILNPKDIPDIEIHAVMMDENLDIDLYSQYYKYFFERWDDSTKDKYIINEKYEDSSYKSSTQKKWLLHYETVIEVHSYSEMLDATESIIRFIEYMGNRKIMFMCNIKVGKDYFQICDSVDETNEEIRKNAKNRYMDCVKNQNLQYDNV